MSTICCDGRLPRRRLDQSGKDRLILIPCFGLGDGHQKEVLRSNGGMGHLIGCLRQAGLGRSLKQQGKTAPSRKALPPVLISTSVALISIPSAATVTVSPSSGPKSSAVKFVGSGMKILSSKYVSVVCPSSEGRPICASI